MNKELYDKVCNLKTAYENLVSREADDYMTDDLCMLADKMYYLLEKIQNECKVIK